jgi:hypothetical protein
VKFPRLASGVGPEILSDHSLTPLLFCFHLFHVFQCY